MATQEQIMAVKKTRQMELMQKNNVAGVGIGYKIKNGKVTKDLSLVTLVIKKVAQAEITEADLIPSQIEGVNTDVIEVGKVIAHKARTDRWRPAQPGVSLGHYAITAGTFGAVVRDKATGQRLILSNNHVMANSNNAQIGDTILQPGPADGGRNPQDRIASLERFQKIEMEGDSNGGGSTCSIANIVANLINLAAITVGSKHRLFAQRMPDAKAAAAPNLVDAAVARPVSEDAIKDEIIDIGKVTQTREPEIGMKVTKSGRTTQTTEGEITTLNALIQVSYGAGKIATFEDQIITSHMSEPGDSGSLLVGKEGNAAVGLLFAGSDKITIHSPIQFVMDALNIDFNI